MKIIWSRYFENFTAHICKDKECYGGTDVTDHMYHTHWYKDPEVKIDMDDPDYKMVQTIMKILNSGAYTGIETELCVELGGQNGINGFVVR